MTISSFLRQLECSNQPPMQSISDFAICKEGEVHLLLMSEGARCESQGFVAHVVGDSSELRPDLTRWLDKSSKTPITFIFVDRSKLYYWRKGSPVRREMTVSFF